MVLCYTIQHAPIKLTAKAKNGMVKSFQSRNAAGLQLWCFAENLSSLEYTLELSHSPKNTPWMWASASIWWDELGNCGWERGAIWVLVWTASALSRGSCKIWPDLGDSSVSVLWCHNNIRAYPLGPIFVNRITSLLIFFPRPLPPVTRWKVARPMKHLFPCWALPGVCWFWC